MTGKRLGACWDHLGLSWGHLGAFWGHLGASRSHLGAILGPSWGHLGAICGHLGAILELAGAILAFSPPRRLALAARASNSIVLHRSRWFCAAAPKDYKCYKYCNPPPRRCPRLSSSTPHGYNVLRNAKLQKTRLPGGMREAIKLSSRKGQHKCQ